MLASERDHLETEADENGRAMRVAVVGVVRGVLVAALACGACSGGRHSVSGSGPDIETSEPAPYPRPERRLECLGAADDWPEASDASQMAFCKMFAHSVALCEAPFDGQSCERVAWEDRRAAELVGDCMSRHVAADKLPYWIDSLFACSYGDDYDKGDYFMFPCPDRYPCWRSIGMDWTPAPDARSYSTEP